MKFKINEIREHVLKKWCKRNVWDSRINLSPRKYIYISIKIFLLGGIIWNIT
jgi:hypothetical protein